MVVTSARFRLRRLALAVLCLSGAPLLMTAGPAQADRPTVIDEDNTGFACDYYPEGQTQVSTSVNYDAISGRGYSTASVFGADGETHLADGYTTDVVVTDGRVSARYPLLDPDGVDAGEVVLEGTYEAASDPVTLRNRFPYARNAQIIGSLVYTPLEVTWTTFQVGGYDVSGITCEGQRSETINRVLEPHRVVYRFGELHLLESCTTPPLTGLAVSPSEAGVSLYLSLDGYDGDTNLALDDGSDSQPVRWYAEGGDLTDVTSIAVTLTPDGHSRSEVDPTADGLVLQRIQPVTLAYDLGLPASTQTVSGECAAESVDIRVAVEPA